MAKKREMFLVQMSLDVKKAEILKLDARAKDKEEAGLLANESASGDSLGGSNCEMRHFLDQTIRPKSSCIFACFPSSPKRNSFGAFY